MKAVFHGASEFLVKPVRLEQLKTIWQHVIRKKKDNEDLSAQKKSQSVWSVELHHKFVAAVNQLGIDSMFSTLTATQTIFISYQFPRA
jgi:two-component response regulator ARR-B family